MDLRFNFEFLLFVQELLKLVGEFDGARLDQRDNLNIAFIIIENAMECGVPSSFLRN